MKITTCQSISFNFQHMVILLVDVEISLKNRKKIMSKLNNKTELRESLIRMGVPVLKNDKLFKKDLFDLKCKDSGIEVIGLKFLGSDNSLNEITYSWHLELSDNSVNIEEIFRKNKKWIEAKILHYLRKLGLGIFDSIDLIIKNKNKNNIWLDMIFEFNIQEKIAKEKIPFEAFIYKLFEKN